MQDNRKFISHLARPLAEFNVISLALGFLLSCGSAGCANSHVNDTETPKDADLPDASTDPVTDPDRGGIPLRPDASSDNTLDLELTFAVESMRLDQSGVNPLDGLNLDGVDSSPGSPNEGVGECTSLGGPAVDGPHGVDNAFGSIIWPAMAEALGAFDCELESAHRKGLGTLLIHITNWNGLPYDPQVDAFIAPSVLGTHQPDWTSATDAQNAIQDWTWGVEVVEVPEHEGASVSVPYAEVTEGERPDAPCWDDGPYDWFFANRDAFTAGSIPKLRSSQAYIAQDWLVLPLPHRAEFQLFTDRRGLEIPLVQGYLLAKISADRSRFDRAFVAGRLPVNDLVDVGGALGLCHGGELLRELYNEVADLFEDPTRDAPQTTPCVWKEAGTDAIIDAGAVSVGIGLVGRRVNYGGLAPLSATWAMPNACDIFMENPHAPAHCSQGSWTFTPPEHCE